MTAPSTADLAAHLVETADALPDGAKLLASMIMDRLQWDADGSPTVVDREGRPVLDAAGLQKTPAALIADFKREIPSFFDWPKSGAPPSAGGRWTGKTAAVLAERDAARQREATGQKAERPNPFAKRTWNLTEQVLMKHRNPALAAQLEAAAGV